MFYFFFLVSTLQAALEDVFTLTISCLPRRLQDVLELDELLRIVGSGFSRGSTSGSALIGERC